MGYWAIGNDVDGKFLLFFAIVESGVATVRSGEAGDEGLLMIVVLIAGSSPPGQRFPPWGHGSLVNRKGSNCVCELNSIFHIYVWEGACVRVCICLCTCMCERIYIYIRMHSYIYVHVLTHIH